MGGDSCATQIGRNMMTGAGVGVFTGLVEAAWRNPPSIIPSDKAIIAAPERDGFRRVGAAIAKNSGILVAVSAAYTGGKCAAESFRGHHHPANSAFGGALAGLAVGFMGRRSPQVTAACVLGFSLVALGCELQGNSMYYSPRYRERLEASREPLPAER